MSLDSGSLLLCKTSCSTADTQKLEWAEVVKQQEILSSQELQLS